MYLKITGIVAFLCTLSAIAFSQAVDNTASFRMIDADRYVRMHYENDFFSGIDLYYTQGINLEIVNPTYKKFPLNRILLVPANSVSNYGISIEHNGYTPSSITHDNILVGDRPFAADLMIKSFSFSSNAERSYRVTSSASVGVIGSVASGYWMQRTIHRWLKTTVPHGWQNQIANDVILNYEVGIEKNVFHAGQFLIVNGFANARAGTLNDKATAGIIIMAGKINNAIRTVFARGVNHHDVFNLHVYAQPMINAVGYDATMQGGVFNRNSPYTIPASQIERVTLQANYGVVASFHALNVEYFQSVINKEFSTGINHRWGGIRIGVAF